MDCYEILYYETQGYILMQKIKSIGPSHEKCREDFLVTYCDSIRGCVRPLVCWSVGPSVHRSVGPWVHQAFMKNGFFVDFWALLLLPTCTRLMAVFLALFVYFFVCCMIITIIEPSIWLIGFRLAKPSTKIDFGADF